MGTPNRAEYELLDIGAKRCFGKEKSQQVMMGMGNTKNTSNIANMMIRFRFGRCSVQVLEIADLGV